MSTLEFIGVLNHTCPTLVSGGEASKLLFRIWCGMPSCCMEASADSRQNTADGKASWIGFGDPSIISVENAAIADTRHPNPGS
mmetsp:Transcript_43166/g.120090  ORF Transcript_43166/g.120090 Transcript_43166/m.120090 type:complete len:83 (-) Transcript_43166:19-267(-)